MKTICVVAFLGMLLWCCAAAQTARAAEPGTTAAGQTIQTEEVKDAAEAEQQKVSLADVEKSRLLTDDRLYGLAGFWLLIILVIFLIRCQVRDDEKLYDQGYYEKNIDHP
jgi:hypothetical protein